MRRGNRGQQKNEENKNVILNPFICFAAVEEYVILMRCFTQDDDDPSPLGKDNILMICRLHLKYTDISRWRKL